ncbi:MAG TPA: AAA family ATPase [Candidatus Thiothrix moscowensis]|uniref:AAA family ATPase n=1 Tax=unclassified Thiothrix TaxID=2636184 RepID=UPI0025CE3471|nr:MULTISPECIES: AAA family ATPase [unclassified Thiothrix]HRJ54098.1 AAA family ATPase [Candidatus Thiothrix moscowensis]HRJ94244.1 AAA family ATPase [Candidatus Thiothrix moscowensis]
MKIPYGESNFKKVITGGYVYIDKTAYIAQLETAGSYHFLLRPRRFGKSLFVSMLWHYYDMAHQHEFEALFGKLHIGQCPTPLKNSYQVLLMDFSGIATATPERVYDGFAASVNTSLGDFLHRYGYAPEVFARISGKAAPEEKIRIFFEAVKMAGQKILLLIDEYDHFANTLLAEDLSLFQSIMGKGGFVRSFYEVLKSATMTGVLDRLFVTGVTPLMLDSLTSGFNIAKNLSIHVGFNAAMGFTHEETHSLIDPVAVQCGLNTEAVMTDVTDWYNGYRFHPEAAETVFNSDMVLYFVMEFNRQHCTYPKRMLDENIASDYRKIMALFQIGDRDANYQVLDDLINNGDVLAVQQRKFELDKHFDRNDFISLLAYMGFVTISGETMTQTRFAIPNHVIRELYFQYFKVELEQRNQLKLSNQTLPVAIETLALQGDLQPLAVEMQQVLAGLSNRDLIKLDEKHIKTLLLTLLYQFPIYFIHSEREMDKKYPDVLLLERSPFAVKHQHLIELKYAKKGDGAAGWEAKKQEGIAQVQGYLQLSAITALPKLRAWLMLTDSERVEVIAI